MIIRLERMETAYRNPVRYTMAGEIEMNGLVGRSLSIAYREDMSCLLCGRKIRKSFARGSCYRCFRSAPENSECIIRPQLCRGHLGEGRDPRWEKRYHCVPHVVYLAFSGGVKVGVTTEGQIPTRWINQGASEAIVFARTPYRQLAGHLEVALKQSVSDQTNWRKMLTDGPLGERPSLLEEKRRLAQHLSGELAQYVTDEDEILSISYPVERFPTKIISWNLEKDPLLKGTLTGIRGQYLYFDVLYVLNVSKYGGYWVDWDA